MKKIYSHDEAKSFCYRVGDNFYKTPEWKYLRRCAFLIYGRECHCCYSEGSKQHPLHIDHIKPKSLFPQLCLDITNLQVLCEECNMLKSNIIFEDYRPNQHIENAAAFKLGTKRLKQIIMEQATKSELLVPTKKKRKKTQNPVNRLEHIDKTISKKKYTHKQVLDIQKTFLDAVRQAINTNKQWDVLAIFTNTYGEDVMKYVVSICRVKHWFRGERPL